MSIAPIRILGIDPGLRHTGWGMIECAGSRLAFLACGTVHSNDKLSLADRLRQLHEGLMEVIHLHRPDEAAVEETFVNRDPQSALRLGQARGVALVAPSLAGLQVAEYAASIPIHMKIRGMREKHVLREATRDVLIPQVYDRQKHPFTTPPIKIGEDDAMLELFGDVFASRALDNQPIFEPAAVRDLFDSLKDKTPEERLGLDGLLNRILSMTLMNERFGMSA